MTHFDHMHGGQVLPNDIAAAPLRGYRVFNVEPTFHMTQHPSDYVLASTYACHYWQPVPPEGPHPAASCQTYDQRLSGDAMLSDLQSLMNYAIPSGNLSVTTGSWQGLPGAVPSTSSTNTSGNWTTTTVSNMVYWDLGNTQTFPDQEAASRFVQTLIDERLEYAKQHLEHVPVVSCGCGYWMVKDENFINTAVGTRASLPGQLRAVAEVEGWGRTIEHEHGYRCQYMRIRSLKLVLIDRRHLSEHQRLARLLEARYQVPVSIELLGLSEQLGRSYSKGQPKLTRGDKLALGGLALLTGLTLAGVAGLIVELVQRYG